MNEKQQENFIEEGTIRGKVKNKNWEKREQNEMKRQFLKQTI